MRQSQRKDRIVKEAIFWVRLLVVILLILIDIRLGGGSHASPATSDYFQWFKDAGYPASYSQ
jgi:hypothetical protein